MQPVNTPRHTSNWVYDPKVPEISVGESSLTIKGAIALKNPTQNPWQSLKKMSNGKYSMYISAPTVKAKAFMMSRHFLNIL